MTSVNAALAEQFTQAQSEVALTSKWTQLMFASAFASCSRNCARLTQAVQISGRTHRRHGIWQHIVASATGDL